MQYRLLRRLACLAVDLGVVCSRVTTQRRAQVV